MAIKVQSSFSAGELDPSLHERTTFDKYKSGLKTARNVIIGKSGRITSAPGRMLYAACKDMSAYDYSAVLFAPRGTNVLFEFGHNYVRVHDLSGSLPVQEIDTTALSWTGSVIKYLKFSYGNKPPYTATPVGASGTRLLYVFSGGVGLNMGTGIIDFTTLGACALITASSFFTNRTGPVYQAETLTGTGYNVEYCFTTVRYGVESAPTTRSTGALPIAVAEYNSYTFNIGAAADLGYTEMRVYRRPRNAGAFGYIGSSTYKTVVGADLRSTFEDRGQAADYSHQPPAFIETADQKAIQNVYVPAGCVYQQRLIIADHQADKAIYLSRPNVQNEFYRNFPLDSDSALSFKYGSGDFGKVLWMIDSDGLAVFTTAGVFLHTGEIGPTNLALARKGPWVASSVVPPLAIPGGVIFIDTMTNTVRVLAYSQEAQAYTGEELSVFSDHLFKGKFVVSWSFHEGTTPLLYVVFSDGTMATLTYERNHEMRAWTRHDGLYPVEYVCGTDTPTFHAGYSPPGSTYQNYVPLERTFFVVNVDGVRYIEESIHRYPLAFEYVGIPETNLHLTIAAMHGVTTKYSNGVIYTVKFSPITDWSSDLKVTGVMNLFLSANVGDIIRWFHPKDLTSIDFEVISISDYNNGIVRPSQEFPSEYGNSYATRVFLTHTTITGLGHLEGQPISVIVDGAVICSPFNDQADYNQLTVAGGVLTLPTGVRGAITHVGRPYVMDIETLDIDTVEQRPVLVESKICNKVMIKTENTRGFFVGPKFPANNFVGDMQEIAEIDLLEEEEEVVGNRPDQPVTKRHEITIPGEWKVNSRVCVRNVDPVHFDFLSIMPDIDDQRR